MEVKDIISSGLLELYAAGLASQEEAAQVLLWVQQHPEVADELAQIEASLAMYAQASGEQPAAAVKEKVFELINGEEGSKVVSVTNVNDKESVKVVRISSIWKYVAAAAIVLLTGSAVINLVQFNKNVEVNKQLQQSKQLANNLQQQNKAMDDYLEKVRSKFSTPVSLAGLTVSDASAKVFWMKDNGDVYVDPSNLPALEKGKQYELWAIIEGNPAPVNAGIIITTKEGNTYSIQKMKNFANAKVQAFAVSVEKENSTPAASPTEVFAMGKM